MIPTLGLNAAILMGEEEEKNTKKRTAALVIPAILFVVAVLTNDFHQFVFSFPNGKPFIDQNYQLVGKRTSKLRDLGLVEKKTINNIAMNRITCIDKELYFKE